jgi:hypothetical protein
MKRLKKLINPYITKSETDNHMSTILNHKFDDELKTRYADILEKKYNVTRSTPEVKTRKIYPWMGIAAATVAMLVMALTFLNQKNANTLNPSQLAQNYIEQNPVYVANSTRGGTIVNDNKISSAYQLFENGEFQKALGFFESANLNEKEDIYYMAHAQLMTENYTQAYNSFSKISAMISTDDWLAESRLYAIVSLYADEKIEMAERKIADLKKDTWEYDQVQKFLKNK